MSEHASDCAIHNAPALPVGECDCGYDRPMSSELAGILPKSENSVTFTKLANGEYLVTELTIVRRIQSEEPSFRVVKGLPA